VGWAFLKSQFFSNRVVGEWWWCYPTFSEEWGRGAIPRIQQSGHASRSGPEIKNRRISAM